MGRRAALLGTMLLLTACGGQVAGSDAEPSDAGVVASSSAPTVFAWSDASSAYLPVGGATVCVNEHPEVPCATTAADGSYAMDLPFLAQAGSGGARVAFTATRPGSYGATKLEVLSAPLQTELLPTFYLWSAEGAPAFAVDEGFSADTSTTGMVGAAIGYFWGHGAPSTEGASLVLTTEDGQSFQPVYYDDDESTPDRSLTSCVEGCYAVFVGVPPGPFTITAVDGERDGQADDLAACPLADSTEDFNGWPAPTRNAAEGLAVAGSWTGTVIVDCR